MDVDEQDLLYGADPTPGVVAVEPDASGRAAVFVRTAPDRVTRTEIHAQPWILLPAAVPAPPSADVQSLVGDGFNRLARFDTAQAWQAARNALRDSGLDHIAPASLTRGALLSSGVTLFKGTEFESVRRLQFDIETTGLDAAARDARILMVAVADSTGYLDVIEGEEADVLARFVELVRLTDPDVLEGHNVFGFDLPYLAARATATGVPLALGRDGSAAHEDRERRFSTGAFRRSYQPWRVYGRHVLDTYLLVQRWDWSAGRLSGYGLKECARVLGLAADDRVEIPGAEIAEAYRTNPDLVRTYARQDAEETRALADLITPVEFYQAQMLPDSYQNATLAGAGEKINALMMRAYLRAGHAVPFTQAPRDFSGAHTEVRRIGIIEHVCKADVESLYPSIMLARGIAPRSDSLNVFLPMLRSLTSRRLEAKRRAAARAAGEPGPGSFVYWDGLQASYKVFINSFYGYLGAQLNWNDYAAADEITRLGREMICRVADDLEQRGASVIEIDTDGVYFSPPSHVADEPAERALVEAVGAGLERGIRLAFDGRYARMLSLKIKNYVLEAYDGRLIFRGGSLRSRADERFGRRFIETAVGHLLHGQPEEAAALYRETADAIVEHRLPPRELARRERITSRTQSSAQRRRLAAAAAEARTGEYVEVYERADGTLGRIEEFAHDENVPLYLEKLYRFALRIEDGFGGAFHRMIPRPTRHGLPDAEQTAMDLFADH